MGNSRKISIGILTSSRADYGIYLPLLDELKSDEEFDLHLLVFGTHLSQKYGYTVNQIIRDNFSIAAQIETLVDGDTPSHISESMGKTLIGFKDVWMSNQFDLVFALGDRYEMFAAVASSVPFNIPVAHIHGGESTLGAIDNVFRHSISCMSKFHFTTTETYKNRVIEIIGTDKYVYNVGALSIDTLKNLELLSIKEFKNVYHIDLSKPSILITFHPETISFEKNREYIKAITDALSKLDDFQQIITMPNADTFGLIIRNELIRYASGKPNVHCVESFGSKGYLSCMKHCSMMLGNTSSGFAEAAYFSKPVINLGERQKGRIETPNIQTISIKSDDIINAVMKVTEQTQSQIPPVYGNGDAATKIKEIIKKK